MEPPSKGARAAMPEKLPSRCHTSELPMLKAGQNNLGRGLGQHSVLESWWPRWKAAAGPASARVWRFHSLLSLSEFSSTVCVGRVGPARGWCAPLLQDAVSPALRGPPGCESPGSQ